MKQKITPCLWFDKEAKEAAELYTSAFKGPKAKNTTTINNTPSGSVDIITIEISGQEFTLISAGPLFKINPSISLHVKCRTKDEVGSIWEKLSKEGKVLMELGEYPFSKRYGWVQDKFGVSWQIVPNAMEEMLKSKDKKKIERVTEAFLKMKKYDIKTLKQAYDQK